MFYDGKINVHSIIESSRVNGPGKRLVVFFQGCQRKCDGCFNQDTHSGDVHLLYTPENILNTHLRDDVWGLTVSGGEPFLQPQGLTALLKRGREYHGLTSVVFTGFLYEEIQKYSEMREALKYADVLIDGPYKKNLHEPTLLTRGSTNQRIHFLTDTYKIENFIMPGRSELIIQRDGSIIETGFNGISTPKNLFT